MITLITPVSFISAYRRGTFIMVVLQFSSFKFLKNVTTAVVALFLCHTSSFKTIHSRTSTIFDRSMMMNAGIYPYQPDIENTARNAVLAAGKIILKGSGTIDLSSDTKSKIGSRDIVTECDINAQMSIKDTISAAFPTHKFLGEEDIAPGRAAATAALEEKKNEEHLWIIDPIDGTTNFAHGQPLCGVILAYASKGQVLFGCIYDPFRGEMFTAWEGQGAYMNGQKISCCSTSELSSSVVCTGSPPNLASLAACLRATNLISSEVRTVRMLGSASIMLSWLACGRVTSYFEADMNVWDLAAGCLLVKEAGGQVTDVWGKSYELTTRNLVASNGKIHDELLGRLMVAECWIKEEDEGSRK